MMINTRSCGGRRTCRCCGFNGPWDEAVCGELRAAIPVRQCPCLMRQEVRTGRVVLGYRRHCWVAPFVECCIARPRGGRRRGGREPRRRAVGAIVLSGRGAPPASPIFAWTETLPASLGLQRPVTLGAPLATRAMCDGCRLPHALRTSVQPSRVYRLQRLRVSSSWTVPSCASAR